jgi:N-alpha-acetyltransferase 38, NatC auxiliary subunit
MSPTPPLDGPSPTRPALAAFRRLLRRSIRLTSVDGRVFLGTLIGTDKALNVLLIGTHEFRPSAPPGTPHMEGGRFVGQIMVPWRRVAKVELEGGLEEEEDLYT